MTYKITFPDFYGVIRWFTDTPERTLLGGSYTKGTVEIPEDAVCRIWMDYPPASLEFLRDCPDIKISLLAIYGRDGELDISPIGALRNLSCLKICNLQISQKAWDSLNCPSLEELDIIRVPLQGISLEFLRTLPKLRRLLLDGQDLMQEHLLQINELQNLVSLKIFYQQSHSRSTLPARSNLEEITSLQSLQNLEELKIYHPHFTDDFFEYLAPFNRLSTLHCSGETFTQNAISNLLTHFPIRELFLHSTKKQDTVSGFDVVSQAPLQALSLTHFHLDNAGIQMLSHHKSLERIDLRPADAQMPPISLKPLTNLPRLSFLRLTNILIEEPDVFSHLPSLQLLSLHQTLAPPCSPPYVPILGRPMLSPPVWQEIGELPHLKRLSLDGTCLSDEDFASLKNLSELESLCLWERTLTSDGLVALKECKNLSDLTLGDVSLTQNIIRLISKLPRLTEMRTIRAELRPEDIGVLCELQNLIGLSIDDTLLLPKPLEGIRKCLPHCFIQHTES